MKPRFPIVFFDLDGTLLRGAVSLELARWLGREGELDGLEEAYRHGRVSNAEIANASAGWLAGRTTGEVAEVLAACDWIDGIEATMAALRQVGTRPVLATVTWEFAAQIVAARFGLAGWCGTRMDHAAGVLTGVVAQQFSGDDKATFVEACCAEHGVDPSEVAAVGDSRSDLPMFRRVGYSIALNAEGETRAIAATAIDTDDLRDLLPLLVGPS